MNRRIILSILLLIELSTISTQAYAARPINEHIQVARDYMQSNQWDYASDHWRAVLEQDPKNWAAHEGLTVSLIRAGFSDEAINHLETLKLRMKDPKVDLLLANIYKQQGNVQQTARFYMSALEKQPFNPVAFRQLNLMVKKLPKRDAQLINRILQKRIEMARVKANELYSNAKYTEASHYYQVISDYSRSFNDINDYGLSLLLSGNNKEASKQFGLLKNKTKSWMILSNAALAELSMGRYYSARKITEYALSLCEKPDQKAVLYNHLGYIYEASKKNMQARFAYEKAIALKEDFVKAQLNQAYIYRQNGLYNEALKVYKTLLKTNPQNAEIWTYLGFTYELKHEASQAINAYRKAAVYNPEFKEAYYYLGTLYKKMGKMDKANETFKTVVGLEFSEIEQKNGQPIQSTAANLLKYVDVFTSHPPIKQTMVLK